MEVQHTSFVEEIKQVIETEKVKSEESQVLNVSNDNLQKERNLQTGVKIFEIVAKVYETTIKKLQCSHLEKFENRMSKISYKSTTNLFKYIEALSVSRKEMIEIVNSCADTLDNSYHMATIGRLLGSLVDLFHNLDSFIEYKLSNFVTEEAFGINPILGFVSQALCKCVPYFAYLGLLSSFTDVLNSKAIMTNVLKIIKEDIESFEHINEWFEETNKLDAKLKKLFPFGLDADIVSDIEQSLVNCKSHTKVFCTVFFSNAKQDPSLMTDETFLCKALLFSRNEIAVEWYDRALKMKHPIEFEAEKLEYISKLNRLSKCSPDSNATAELGNHVIKLKNAPHIVQATINCVSIYFSFQEWMIGAKHKNSELLRELSKRAKICLDELEHIKCHLQPE